MFLNKTRFKKWVKEAFQRGGLVVGKIYDGLVIAGNNWVVWTREGDEPNWVKAAVMEYTGELPLSGHMFRAKNEEPLQYEIPENEYLNLPERFMEATVPFTETPMIYDDGLKQFRFLQNSRTKEIIAVSTYLYDVLDMRELGEESRPSGPSAVSDEGSILIWKNENSALAFGKIDISEKSLPVMNLLSNLSFDKEGK